MGKSLRTGLNEKMYRNTGTHGSPVWSEMTNVGDVSLPLKKSTGKILARLSKQVRHLAGSQEGPLDFDMVFDKSNATSNVIRDAYIADTIMEFAICDQAITNSGAAYYKDQYLVTEFPVEQKLENGEMCKIKAEPSYLGLDGATAVDGAWVDVA